MDKLGLVLIGLVIGASIGFFATYIMLYQPLTYDYEDLQAEYYALQSEHVKTKETLEAVSEKAEAMREELSRLQIDIQTLETEKAILETEISSLERELKEKIAEYMELQSYYRALDSKYSELFSDYELMRQILDMPLKDKTVPTTDELTRWVYLEDRVNEIGYSDPDFVCGDYAVMLAIHAKEKSWDMGVVCIWGYDDDTGEDFSHAMNVIITTEGLVYVEPQTDDVFWYEDYKKIRAGVIYEIGEDQWIYVEGELEVLNY